MYEEYDARTRLTGYGNTREEALKELQFNILRDDITRDPEWVKRKQFLHSWCPTKNSLVFTGVTAVVYDSGYLCNTKTNKKIKLVPDPLCQFISLFSILDTDVTFSDFCITYSESIDKFFYNISPEIGRVRDFPVCKPGSFTKNAKGLHLIDDRAMISELISSSSITVSNLRMTYEIPVPVGVPILNVVAYGLAKLGLHYNGEELT